MVLPAGPAHVWPSVGRGLCRGDGSGSGLLRGLLGLRRRGILVFERSADDGFFLDDRAADKCGAVIVQRRRGGGIVCGGDTILCDRVGAFDHGDDFARSPEAHFVVGQFHAG